MNAFQTACQTAPDLLQQAHAMRLLVVEDEPDLLAGLVSALRRQGYAVDAAVDGEEGLYKAKCADYDAIVLDVMLTARDRSADRVRGLDTGADDYLVKPFDNAELFARLRAIIRRSTRQARSLLVIGEVQVDTAARTVTRAGQPVTLTAREYIVLEYLALHRGEVVTRTDLYEHLFDENDDTLSNVLDVHIFNLRKKLGQDFILTRRGHGYSIA